MSIDGQQWSMYREGVLRGAFILEPNRQVAARARRLHALVRLFHVEAGNSSYTLDASSNLSRTFVVRRGAAGVGHMRSRSLLGRTALVDIC